MNTANPNLKSRRAPEAWWAADLFKIGFGYVVVSRFKLGDTLVESGVFLVDTYCLGVKGDFLTRLGAREYEIRLLKDLNQRARLEKVEPVCARKLVEEAAAYAANLGFSPDPDYKQACRVFGGIEAKTCSRSFVFGREGKPTYVRGPSETEEQAKRIIWQLHRRCGEGNYSCLVALGEAEDISASMGL